MDNSFTDSSKEASEWEGFRKNPPTLQNRWDWLDCLSFCCFQTWEKGKKWPKGMKQSQVTRLPPPSMNNSNGKWGWWSSLHCMELLVHPLDGRIRIPPRLDVTSLGIEDGSSKIWGSQTAFSAILQRTLQSGLWEHLQWLKSLRWFLMREFAGAFAWHELFPSSVPSLEENLQRRNPERFKEKKKALVREDGRLELNGISSAPECVYI